MSLISIFSFKYISKIAMNCSRKKSMMPFMQTTHSEYFGVDKQGLYKIKLIQDKRFAEFNYYLLNNILLNIFFQLNLCSYNYKCKMCTKEIENS